MTKLSGLAEQLGKYDGMPSSLPPVDQWNPELSGEIDIVIKADGTWFHEGDEIKRAKLVRLFSTILKREGDDYYLVTPVEKWKISVEDLPFVAVLMEQTENGLFMATNVGDEVQIGEDHPILLDEQSSAEPNIPYVPVRAGLNARINRNVFYDLADQAHEKDGAFYVKIGGSEYCIG